MSRHAHRSVTVRRRRRRPLLIGLASLLSLAFVAAVMIQVGAVPGPLRNLAAKTPLIGDDCPSPDLTTTSLALTVAPELQGPVTRALQPLNRRTLDNHECVQVTIQAQESSDTVQSAQILPVDRAPDLWIPDSSLWQSRVPRWPVANVGSFAASPIVIATSQQALDKLGWGAEGPTWVTALAGEKPVAVPRIAEDAAGLSAVIALWQSLGKGEEAQRALAATVLATGRSEVPTEAEAIRAAESGSESAPLLPTSLQAVTALNSARGTDDDVQLVAVRPTGGSPFLDYPLLTPLREAGTDTAEVTETRERAIQAVIDELLSARSTAIIQAAGFDVPENRGAADGATSIARTANIDGSAPQTTESTSPISGLAPAEMAALVDRVTVLSAPSRFLAIFDLSGSMRAGAGNGQSRIAFAATAATLAGNLLTDRAQVGLWGFSRDLVGEQDILKIEDVAELGSKRGSGSHRDAVNSSMANAFERLGGNGTALYTAAIAGMEEMNKLYDPRAGNAVVLFTDGANQDPGGPSTEEALAELERLYNPKKPVRLVVIGIGDGVDIADLTPLASSAGGQAHLATDPQQLPTILFEAMNRRDD